MKLTKILTKKLTSFWLLSLMAVACVFLLCAGISFIQLTYKFQQQQVKDFNTLMTQQVQHFSHLENAAINQVQRDDEQGRSQAQLAHWLPQLLANYHTVEFRLFEGDKLRYSYNNGANLQQGVRYKQALDGHWRMELVLVAPFYLHALSWQEYWVLLIGFAAIFALVFYGQRWFAQELDGVEELAMRSHLILDGKLEQALASAGSGKPRLINRALTRLLEQLQDAQRERGRFDKFIRSNVFLDPQTRIGNQLFFVNRLDGLSQDQQMISHGAMYLIDFADLDIAQQEKGDQFIADFLTQLVNSVNQALTEHVDSIFSRRSFQQFAIVVPQLSLTEADSLANKLLKICISQAGKDFPNQDNFVHLGAAFYRAGDNQQQLLEEADMALKAAQLQRSNNWFMYDKGAVDEEIAKGSVRWRSFLESSLLNKRVISFSQGVFDSDNTLHHHEVFSRIRDNQGKDVRATLFIPMANKCGLMPQIERQLLERVFFTLMPQSQANYSVNLSLDSLTSRAFMRWLKTLLLEHRPLATRLIFEISEDIIVKHQSKLTTHLDMLKKMGAKLCVDHVGQQVVGTHYIQECDFDFVKLHKSIIRKIHLRSENQLFIRSFIGGLYRAEVQVFAEGVTSFEEWQTLKILGVSAAQGEFLGEVQEANYTVNVSK
ncbi:diguanylate cyclase/phosphodiesterase [Shewanella denitrificans OS217]|uniref:Diguanylate cyclase/phosphodiesterase n=1 Tax=Shewanella denitrificans (strain OS217 / ATCC BAA-1090 / DSM 15013) TaxID=318161 RepID=Q12IU8_SHEDO|nr:RNase E specificity factor CsrD [Shewanella denitrificans]ABE56628.1 diguanylate cyclase/phosphodiesterase [Shewanella denitrificans OS217]